MGNISNSKTINAFVEVISSIAMEAANSTDGIKLHEDKRKKDYCKVSFLENDKIVIDLKVDVDLGTVVPTVVANLQDKVKNGVEKSTKYKVNTINVEVVSVLENTL